MSHRQEFPDATHKVGLGLVASAGLVSALSTFSLLSFIGWNVLFAGSKRQPVSYGLRLFTLSSLGLYLISLLLCDFLQGVAFSLNFYWAAQGVMYQGKVCVVQGLLSQIGDLGAAIWSTAIAFHTFSLLVLINQPRQFTVLSVLIIGWSILILLPILGPTIIQTPERGSFYGLSGAWCWMGRRYRVERVVYLYGWMFSALGFSFIIYTLIYLRLTGFMTWNGLGKIKLHFRRPTTHYFFGSGADHLIGSEPPRVFGRSSLARSLRRNSGATSHDLSSTSDGSETAWLAWASANTRLKRVARRIMWYPLLYAVVAIPICVCGMGVLAGWEPPFGLLVFSGICFGSSGLSNTILFVMTRKSFITQEHRKPATDIRITVRNSSTTNDGEIQSDPIKFSPAPFVTTSTDSLPVAQSGHFP